MVASNTVNRERGLSGVDGHARELGFDPAVRLAARATAPARSVQR
ncbi:hypothetical protein [Streptomyces sp. NPDC058701]